MNEDNNLTPQQPQTPIQQNPSPLPDPNSLATQINQQYQNGQPQQFAQPQFQAQYPPNGQMYGPKPKSHMLVIVLGIVLFLAIGGGALYQFVLSGDDEPTKKSAVSVDEDEKKSSDDEVDEEDSAPTVNTQQAKVNDSQRTADLNAIYQKLEEYFNEFGGYPAEALSVDSLVNIDEDALVDESGNPIVQLENSTALVAPENPYTFGEKPEQGEYTYAPYECGTDSFGLLCSKYMLYGWLELDDDLYVRQSLN